MIRKLTAPLLLAMMISVSPAHADLVGLWRFDGDVSPQPDSTVQPAYNHSGELRNDVKWANDPVRGGVMEFDGDQDYLEVTDTDALSITGDMTVAAWANFTSFDSWNSIVSKTGVNSTNKPSPYDVYTNRDGDGRITAFYGSGDGAITNVISTGAPAAGEWQHVAVTINAAGDVTHYLNGAVNGTGLADAPRIDEDMNLIIGSRADFVTNMLGRMDDVAIFDELLTGDQVGDVMGGDFTAWGVPIPEPTSASLFVLGLLACGSLARRRR